MGAESVQDGGQTCLRFIFSLICNLESNNISASLLYICSKIQVLICVLHRISHRKHHTVVIRIG